MPPNHALQPTPQSLRSFGAAELGVRPRSEEEGARCSEDPRVS
jgi:hypothetical protein